MNIDKLGIKASSIIAVLALAAILGGFVDSRYASAGDLQGLYQSVLEGQQSTLEFQLIQLELQIVQLQSRASLTEAERVVLGTLIITRDQLLRNLADLRELPNEL